MARPTRPSSPGQSSGILTPSQSHNTSAGPRQSRARDITASGKENVSSHSAKRKMGPAEAGARASKRRRTENDSQTLGEDDANESDNSEQSDSGIGGIASQSQMPKSVRFYDPGQDEITRRRVKKAGRALERELNDNRDQLIRGDSSAISQLLRRADDVFVHVKQTSEATLDSRLMASLSDIAYKKTSQMVLGDSSTGIDVDDFVSKCISYMRQTDRPPQSTSRRRRRTQTQGDDEDSDEDEQTLDWAALGAKLCIPSNLRPASSGFLLGPLSVQKKVRQATQRRARLNTQHEKETRPEALTARDMQQTNENSVRTVCAKIKTRLMDHCRSATEAVESSFVDLDDPTEDQVAAEMRRHRITNTGGPGLFDFVLNPDDFGQTVENLFYVSFLIKEGEVGIEEDSTGLPTLSPNTETIQDARERRATRHQAVFGLDFQTWQDLKEAFEITEPLIPTRSTEGASTQVGQRGWYA